jgi:hypothetical protein
MGAWTTTINFAFGFRDSQHFDSMPSGAVDAYRDAVNISPN